MSVRPAKNDYMPRQPGLELPSSRLYVTRRTHGPKEVMAQSDLEAWFSSCGDVQEMKVLKCKLLGLNFDLFAYLILLLQ